MSYIGQEPGQGQAERYIFTASGGETTVTADDDGLSIGYTVNQVSVYLNGVKLVVGTDCIATNGSTITGLSALTASDKVEVIALSSFSPADTVPKSGGTFTGAVTASAGFTANTADINGGTIDGVTITSPVINTGVSGTAILDEDAMGSASATHLATQQSIKAYVDSAATQATTAAQGVGTGDTPKFDIIKTKANNYAYSKGVELSSKGMFQQNFHGVAAHLVATAISQYSGGWTEISGGNFNGWSEEWSSDIFGTFNAANGRFTPTVAGYVLCNASIRINITAGSHLAVGFVRNGSLNNLSGYSLTRTSPNNSDTDYGSMSHIMYCDSDDYLSCWTYNTETNTRVITTESWVSYAYLGGTL